MRQRAKVIALLPGEEAQVSIKRETACGHDCTSCGACGAQARPIIAEVKNPLGAQVGDDVDIETNTSRVLGLACVVYVVPIILLLAFYAIANSIWESEVLSIGGAAFGLLCGVLVSIAVNKAEARKSATSTIVRVID